MIIWVMRVKDPMHLGAVEFKASIPRGVGLLVGKEPLVDNPFHGEVWRQGDSRRFLKGQRRALLQGCSWLVEISGVTLTS